MDANKLKDRLAEAIQLRHMKPIDLARETNISRGAISQYLSGKVQPKQDKIAAMAQVLRVSPAWLMGFSVPISPNPPDNLLARGVVTTVMNSRSHDSHLKRRTVVQWELSLEERDIVETYRKLPHRQRVALKMMLDAFVDPDGSISRKQHEEELAEVNQWLNNMSQQMENESEEEE